MFSWESFTIKSVELIVLPNLTVQSNVIGREDKTIFKKNSILDVQLHILIPLGQKRTVTSTVILLK